MTEIVYTWKIECLNVAPSLDGLSNVVRSAHWRLIGTDGTYTADSYGEVNLQDPDEENFSDYETLTESQVQSWVESALGSMVEDYKYSIASQISYFQAPTIVPQAPPWA